jgi:phosphate transport system protein
MRYAIESACLTLIATQQPMATDLRVIAAVLDISTELERMHDYLKGIAKITLMIGELPHLTPLSDFPQMASRVREMLHQALTAFAGRDEKLAQLARSIPGQDDEVDELYNRVYHQLLALILADPTTADQANYLLWAAHNLERTADRVTNICERVIFTVTGQLVELDSEPESPPGRQL